MNLLVFGANGRTGRQLVRQALEAGHRVTAFVRDPARLDVEHEDLRVVTGDARDADAVDAAVRGQEGVLMALGHTAGSGEDVFTMAAWHAIDAMQRHGVRRLVVLTGAGVPAPEDRPRISHRLIRRLLQWTARDLLEDSEAQAALVRDSDLDWTIVRVPRLTDGPARGRHRVGAVGRGTGPLISRADAAAFMLREVERDAHVGRAPMISA